MDEFWHRYGIFDNEGREYRLVEDLEAARKIGKSPPYKGNALVLPEDDDLMVEWRWFDRCWA